ncbi:F-box/kelch-repeat protein At1g57790-like [Papaver somniferum]|uniref:F-box/kelch-repeat protein At1g57790-like n=1 Tax=Papaver somniferum TaxID=3469 RepID=UPI000E702217|nr:F-box/kelch-repeat protein At1g57790-like [Papaver somniferum]XP_026431854.1 F-box/kelch-repeat protein At1g57790-like [Papaver somniferum]XP_026431855.1 F-box/kelch-repeat protein At1g57790-like [Papaver somniferum]
MFPQVYPPRPNISPALLLYNCFDDDGSIFSFVDPMHNEKYSMKKDLSSEHLLLAGATIRFSKYGWLLLISKDMKTPFFYNPLTKVIIRLPNFPDVGHMLYLSGMSFSSSPTSPDCAVFAIQPMKRNAISIYAIKRGSCAYWRYRVLRNLDGSFVPCFNNPVFFRMEFFCLDYSGTLGRCVIDDEDSNNGLHWGVSSKPLKQFNDAFPSYLVECDGNLLLVNVGPVGETVGVFNLDWTNKVWAKIESLGRHMLFISNTSSFSAIAPPNSQMENKVYFPRLHKDGRGLLFYSLDTGMYNYSINEIHAQQKSIDDPAAPASATNFYDTKEMCNCTWIEPDWSQGNSPTDDPDHLWLA